MRAFVCLALILIALPSRGRAAVGQAECASVDLTSSFAPIRNQGSIETCFAFTAADLLSYNQGVQPPDAISGFDVDLNYATATEDSTIAALANVSAASHDTATKDWIQLYGFGTINTDYQAHAAQALDDSLSAGNEFLALVSYAQAGRACLESEFPSAAKAGADSSIYIKRVDAVVQKQAAIKNPQDPTQYASAVLKQISNLRCAQAKPLKPFVPAIRSVERGTGSAAASFVASQIAVRQPVAIRYDAGFLQSGDDARFEIAQHASLIVGTRWDKATKSCQFKLRNSWGASCVAYDAGFRKRCESGYVWLTEDELKARTEELVTIPANN